MKRALYFCLLLLSWAPHARGMQPGALNKLGRLRTVQGVVLDVENLPLTDAVVRLWSDADRTILLFEGRTNAAGEFRFASIKRGTYFIEFLAPGCHPYLTEINISNVASTTGFLFTPLKSRGALAESSEIA